ncbi:hypothetical protein NMY22_g8860 [Coprinellus aureogranulatus]|nr:hypothetical protein NMY22_g8860 [Coprinellus aureogranulatus]
MSKAGQDHQNNVLYLQQVAQKVPQAVPTTTTRLAQLVTDLDEFLSHWQEWTEKDDLREIRRILCSMTIAYSEGKKQVKMTGGRVKRTEMVTAWFSYGGTKEYVNSKDPLHLESFRRAMSTALGLQTTAEKAGPQGGPGKPKPSGGDQPAQGGAKALEKPNPGKGSTMRTGEPTGQGQQKQKTGNGIGKRKSGVEDLKTEGTGGGAKSRKLVPEAERETAASGEVAKPKAGRDDAQPDTGVKQSGQKEKKLTKEVPTTGAQDQVESQQSVGGPEDDVCDPISAASDSNNISESQKTAIPRKRKQRESEQGVYNPPCYRCGKMGKECVYMNIGYACVRCESSKQGCNLATHGKKKKKDSASPQNPQTSTSGTSGGRDSTTKEERVKEKKQVAVKAAIENQKQNSSNPAETTAEQSIQATTTAPQQKGRVAGSSHPRNPDKSAGVANRQAQPEKTAKGKSNEGKKEGQRGDGKDVSSEEGDPMAHTIYGVDGQKLGQIVTVSGPQGEVTLPPPRFIAPAHPGEVQEDTVTLISELRERVSIAEARSFESQGQSAAAIRELHDYAQIRGSVMRLKHWRESVNKRQEQLSEEQEKLKGYIADMQERASVENQANEIEVMPDLQDTAQVGQATDFGGEFKRLASRVEELSGALTEVQKAAEKVSEIERLFQGVLDRVEEREREARDQKAGMVDEALANNATSSNHGRFSTVEGDLGRSWIGVGSPKILGGLHQHSLELRQDFDSRIRELRQGFDLHIRDLRQDFDSQIRALRFSIGLRTQPALGGHGNLPANQFEIGHGFQNGNTGAVNQPFNQGGSFDQVQASGNPLSDGRPSDCYNFQFEGGLDYFPGSSLPTLNPGSDFHPMLQLPPQHQNSSSSSSMDLQAPLLPVMDHQPQQQLIGLPPRPLGSSGSGESTYHEGSMDRPVTPCVPSRPSPSNHASSAREQGHISLTSRTGASASNLPDASIRSASTPQPPPIHASSTMDRGQMSLPTRTSGSAPEPGQTSVVFPAARSDLTSVGRPTAPSLDPSQAPRLVESASTRTHSQSASNPTSSSCRSLSVHSQPSPLDARTPLNNSGSGRTTAGAGATRSISSRSDFPPNGGPSPLHAFSLENKSLPSQAPADDSESVRTSMAVIGTPISGLSSPTGADVYSSPSRSILRGSFSADNSPLSSLPLSRHSPAEGSPDKS